MDQLQEIQLNYSCRCRTEQSLFLVIAVIPANMTIVLEARVWQMESFTA